MSHTYTKEERFYQEALAENYRQVAKWGLQEHDPGTWLAILVEEVGEVAKAILEGTNLREELTHVAAVAAQWAARMPQ